MGREGGKEGRAVHGVGRVGIKTTEQEECDGWNEKIRKEKNKQKTRSGRKETER